MHTKRQGLEAAQSRPRRRSAFYRAAGGLMLALVCAGVAACGPASSDTASAGDAIAADGSLDTSRLPRTAGAKQIYASPFSTVYTTTDSVAQAAGTIAKTMTSGGWKPYVAPFTDYAKGPDFQLMLFKKGPQALEVSISLAPAQGNATSVSYTGLVPANDLPAPADATDIAFDPSRPYLSCLTAMPVPETMDYYTEALAPMGFVLWPGLAQQAANKKANGGGLKADHAYFVRDDHQPLHLVMHRSDDDKTKIEIEAVSVERMTAELAPDPTPAPSQSRYHAKKPADAMDKMIDNAMQQMTEAILAAAGEAVANASKPTAQRVKSEEKMPDMPPMPPMPGIPAMPEIPAMPANDPGIEAAEAQLVAEDLDGFPIPESHTSTQSGQTKYRTERATTVPAPLASVLAFYRREMPKRGWKETDAIVKGDMTELKLAASGGQATLTLKTADGETAVSFVEKREAEAKKAGILPKAGQAKLILGSMAETPATVTIGKQTIKLTPGMGGGERPDGPMLDLPPGTYAYSVAVPGSPASNEEVVVADGEAWALVIGPGGGSMPLQMY
jgi:hypothetical protein